MNTFAAVIALCLMSALAYPKDGQESNMSDSGVSLRTTTEQDIDQVKDPPPFRDSARHNISERAKQLEMSGQSVIRRKVGPNRNISEKIIGGREAKISDAPWQISLVYEYFGWHICGGSLIGSKTVLTAAHCCDGFYADELVVKYDGLDVSNLGKTNPVNKIHVHPDWDWWTIDNDYCVITLANTVSQSSSVSLVQIADKSPSCGTRAQLTGWGVNDDWINPDHLQYVELNILARCECNDKWQDTITVTKNMMCAISHSGSACYGDSGGALVVDGKQVGIVSWGAAGCPADTTEIPNVFGDPCEQSAKDWIKNLIK